MTPEDLPDAIRITCSNEFCPKSPYVHSACFESFEESVLNYMRSSCPRAKSWSDKQRVQNLWTKRGFELVYKACECTCGQGSVRKDLEWVPPPGETQPQQFAAGASGGADAAGACGVDNNNGGLGSTKQRKRRKSSKNGNPKPNTITIGLPMFNSNGSQQQQQQQQQVNNLGNI